MNDAANFVDRRVFDVLLTHEIHTATRLRYYLSALSLSPDLPVTEVTSALLGRLAEAALRHLRATDVAAVLSASSLTFLLVDAETRNLEPILLRLRDAMDPLIPRARGAPRAPRWSAGGGCYPQTASSASELIQQAVDLMTRAKKDGGDRLYVAPGG